MKKIILAAILSSLNLLPSISGADNLALMRRWVVFPFDVDAGLKIAGENAWWKCREKITDKKKYLVASRQFLIQKDVFQTRKELKPDDVKLLANLLEADVIVTGFSEHRDFTLNVYLGQSGALFWSKKMNFHPSLKASDQLELISARITQELLAVIPYQGFTVVDPLMGKAVYEDGGKQYVTVDVGTTDDLAVGMELQWIDFILPSESNGTPALRDSKFSIIGEGKISKIKRGIVIAELKRAKAESAIAEKSLVRIPQIADKDAKSYVASDSGERLAPEMLPTIINPVAAESGDAHRHTLIFGSIMSVLGILILAF